MNQEEHIDREVRRRVATQIRTSNEEIASLQEKIKQLENTVLQQQSVIKKTVDSPLIHGVVCALNNEPDVDYYCIGDMARVRKEGEFYGRIGKILNIESGLIVIAFDDRKEEGFGFLAKDLEILGKDDGTYAIVASDGKFWEVQGNLELGLNVGDSVRLFANSHKIVGKTEIDVKSGPVCVVEAVHDEYVEVLARHEKILVLNPRQFPLVEGDRVCVDSNFLVILSKIEKTSKFKLKEESLITWDDIGGLESIKEEIRDLFEIPVLNKDVFDFYCKKRPQGVLLYGPPGCGKTIIAKAIASNMAKIYDKESTSSSFIFVKSPEVLSKWIGNSEGEIRNLFKRAREHYEKYGYPAVLAFDEADAIMPTRGTRRSSDISDTIVPMFLSEMDGVDSRQTEANPIIILMTNRVDVLDPAIIRAGRISHHIKIPRPDESAAMTIMDIHFKNCPFNGDKHQIIAIGVADIYSKSRILYYVQNLPFTLGDIVNGAMLSSIVEKAKNHALKRDLKNKTKSGVDLQDLRLAIDEVYKGQQGLNHVYDLEDFAERNKIKIKSEDVVRNFGN
jgi:proteasome-associated ATPase